jgi:hypothetical protein
MYKKVKIRKSRYSFFREDTELLYIFYKKTFDTKPEDRGRIIENVNPIVIIDLNSRDVYSNATHPNISTSPVFYAYRKIFSEVCIGTYYYDINPAINNKRYDILENIFDEYLSQYNDNGYWYPDSSLVMCPTCKRKIKPQRQKVCDGCYYTLRINGRTAYPSDIDSFKNYSISYKNSFSGVNIILTRKKEKRNENI